ncbi:hypothetical protein OPKNFCMD_6383 [Methylobacterium crusticola]|uniref:DNA-directed RNA polymerase II n=1 Tax=Methylobacterium crusticola TaxID=1697972 RepID=A0ABQ4R8F5_9HYPH|nr:hypothetical protein OPKNFCMD_6383 [Methylobacterium crusticola]
MKAPVLIATAPPRAAWSVPLFVNAPEMLVLPPSVTMPALLKLWTPKLLAPAVATTPWLSNVATSLRAAPAPRAIPPALLRAPPPRLVTPLTVTAPPARLRKLDRFEKPTVPASWTLPAFVRAPTSTLLSVAASVPPARLPRLARPVKADPGESVIWPALVRAPPPNVLTPEALKTPPCWLAKVDFVFSSREPLIVPALLTWAAAMLGSVLMATPDGVSMRPVLVITREAAPTATMPAVVVSVVDATCWNWLGSAPSCACVSCVGSAALCAMVPAFVTVVTAPAAAMPYLPKMIWLSLVSFATLTWPFDAAAIPTVALPTAPRLVTETVPEPEFAARPTGAAT